ncbi:hypothetical protein RHGRI_025735 [Rhododendron griersonianum]|uniref:Uncharacterized protein n=1 Tax=Rhododendron griersonianum TaxID=479676 RepID=A0AAV6IRG8_9ERIC|nr:hypothetical protein RHGRI_025735 [Rhododendron griersonianum]
MATAVLYYVQKLWPFSALNKFDDLKVSEGLVRKLSVPKHTKQFVFAIREPESDAVIYVLCAQNLSERSALDAECLIREVQPDTVVVQLGHGAVDEIQSREIGCSNDVDVSVPTSSFEVLKRCFVHKLNKDKYKNVAGTLVLREIFGISLYGHFFAARRVPPEGWLKKLALAHTQKMLNDVNKGEMVDIKLLSEVYIFQIAVEGLRIAFNNAGRLPIKQLGNSNSNKTKFSELDVEEKSHALLAHTLRSHTKNFKSIVAIADTSGLAGLRKHWNTSIPLEIKDMVEQLITNCENDEETSYHGDRKRLLTSKPVVAVGAGATILLGASSLSKAVPASTFMKVVTFKTPASLKLILTQTQKAVAIALSKTVGPSNVVAAGFASTGAKATSALKAAASAQKIKLIHSIVRETSCDCHDRLNVKLSLCSILISSSIYFDLQFESLKKLGFCLAM